MTSAGDLFAAGGAAGRLMAGQDWAATPLGPVAQWPQSLRAAVRLVLASRYPMLLLWGAGFTQLYNDAYATLIGDKHPAALGDDVRITLAESWDVLGPIIQQVVDTGVASWIPALRLLLERAGYREEAYFSVSHAAVRDDGGDTVGVFTVCSEVTEQVVGERRLRLLRDLAVQGGQMLNVERTGAQLAAAIGDHSLDVPFAAVYLREGDMLRRAFSVGTGAGDVPVGAVLPADVRLGTADSTDRWSLRRAASGAAATVPGLAGRLGVAGGPWSDPVDVALAMPLPSADRDQPLGVLLAGVSPSRALDEAYRSFFDLLALQVAVALRNSRAYEEERQRAEALAELDRVKTGFFTNVSHEFRTPLTLMLGPLADALADGHDPLSDGQRARVDTAWRHASRLLTLVNNLLTFSSLEAGGATNDARVVDLAAVTAEVASVFRAAVERAGLRLVVECPPLPRRVAVDPDNWEKIVTNLLSNALKFTFVGQIRLSLAADHEAVRLTVADTGIGIAPQDLARLFERFHRVQGARSRSHEGTGIGLALVRELVRLQGGDVHVTSDVGVGTTFTVVLPWSALEPPGGAPVTAPDHLGATARVAAREAMQWLAGDDGTGPATSPAPPDDTQEVPDDGLRGARILVADDNPDMRDYLTRLLTGQGWRVETAENGQVALDAVRHHPPDLLLTDVMMPTLDGFQLLRALRRDKATRALPVVVLSARAGREAGVEGLDLGADDYVVKPFSAAELVARLRRILRSARIRGLHTRQPSALADTATLITAGRALEDAVRAVTEQARRLLDGELATTTLVGPDGAPRVRITSPAGAEAATPPAGVAAPPTGADPATPPADVGAADPPAGADPAADVVSVPVHGRREHLLGSIAVRRAVGRPAGGEPRGLLSATARMLAALAEGAWHGRPEQRIAAALRRSMPTERLPDVAGWELAARHLPAPDDDRATSPDQADSPAQANSPGRASPAGDGAGDGDRAGGAWYDVFARPDGRVAIAIGDTAGPGLPAAIAMGHLRGALRAYAAGDPSPAAVLARLGALLHRLGDPCRVTLFLGYLDPASGLLEWSNAGHPSPVHGQPGHPARSLAGTHGRPVGAAPDAPPGHRTLLAPGSQLVAYAGGPVTDADRADLLAHASAAGHVDDVVDALAGRRGTSDGGTAVVVVRRTPPAPVTAPVDVVDLDTGWVYPSVPRAPSAMRRDLGATLRAAGVDDDVVDELLIAASEAVNNAVEHAQRPTRPEVVVRLRLSAGAASVSVRDFGSWRDRRPAMDRGRGAALMSAYGDVSVVSTPEGTTVTIQRKLDA